MVDDVKNIVETAESKAAADAVDRARLARERREAEQRKRLDELRAHAAAAQAQRERRDEERQRRQAEQRARDDDRRLQVEERKRAIWEASISRREALLQRERDRSERLERARAARSAPRPAFAFGSSTPRLLEPLDSAGFFWAARRAASTTNVMFASAPLVRRASALQLDSDTDNKDEPDRQQQPVMMWSSVARRRTDLVPTLPAPRAPGRAYSMTRLDKIPTQRPLHSASPSMHHLNRTQPASGETTPGSRPGSALSSATGVLRRAQPRKPRPASIAGTGVNTPRGVIGETGTGGLSVATTPTVSRDSTVVGGDVPRRGNSTPRRPRPHSMHAQHKPALSIAPGDGKPPPHRKPKPPKELDKPSRGKSLSASPGRTLSPSPQTSKDHSVDKEIHKPSAPPDKSQVSAIEVTQKLEALQIHNGEQIAHNQNLDDKVNENKEILEVKPSKPEQVTVDTKPEEKPVEVQKAIEKVKENKEQQPVHMEEPKVEKETPKVEKDQPKVEKEQPKLEKKEEEKKEPSQEKTEEFDMTASMTARRITTEEQAKAALAERRRRAREELERQAELERQRLQREAEEEAERQRQEEERQRREEEEARELAQLQRQHEEEKLRKAIEAQQQLERDEAERKAREEVEKQARLKEDEERRRAAEEAEKIRREEAEKEEKERHLRKQRVEAIMARTRLKKQQEEDKKQQEKTAADQPAPAQSDAVQPTEPEATQVLVEPEATQAQPAPADNGNAVTTGDLLGFETSQPEAPQPAPESAAAVSVETNNGNVTVDLLGLSEQNNTEDTSQEQLTPNKPQPIDNQAPILESNNGNHADMGHISANVGHISANFIQTERLNESQSKAEKLIEDDFTTHNGHGHNHPLTLQNAI